MKKRLLICLLLCAAMQSVLSGCRTAGRQQAETAAERMENSSRESGGDFRRTRVTPGTKITELEDGLSVVLYEGDYGFDRFLETGGAGSDAEVAEYLMEQISSGGLKLLFGENPFGCSTLSVAGNNGGFLFGRNFDWNSCSGLVISARPDHGYASVCTANMDFVRAGGIDISRLPDSVQAVIGLYAPLDGMNEKGLAVSVNMIQDSAVIDQQTGKTGLTTTTAVRLMLDQAADVQEAVSLLEKYDLHASMGMMVHFALADAEGNSAVVEYIGQEMTVTQTPAVTNFYLAQGEKYGTGTKQSHVRYDILMQALKRQETMSEAELRDTLDSVSKDNFGEFESTEWSIVMNQETKELTYFHRENYENGYTVAVGQQEGGRQ